MARHDNCLLGSISYLSSFRQVKTFNIHSGAWIDVVSVDDTLFSDPSHVFVEAMTLSIEKMYKTQGGMYISVITVAEDTEDPDPSNGYVCLTSYIAKNAGLNELADQLIFTEDKIKGQ